MIHDVLRARVDLYLTGEVRHHDALRAASEGVTVVAALHSNSERVTLERLRARLTADCAGVRFVCSAQDRDPFTVM
jgi:putative NIF3 family GTP cyclohydrolase 1 type 2